MNKASTSETSSLTSLTYRSSAAEPMNVDQLRSIERLAQVRNRSEGVTGRAVYDDGRFFQWLEGPVEALSRIWDSVRQDRRHKDIADVRILPAATRMFTGWDMALSIHGESDQDDERDRLPPSQITALAPLLATSAEELTLIVGAGATPVVPIGRIVSEALVIPEMFATHGRVRRFLPAVSPAGARLGALLIAADPRPAAAMVRRLYARAGSLAPLCATVLEPAARSLGDLWLADGCSQFTVTMALCRLQTTLRELLAETAPVKFGLPVVLVVPQPGEVHLLGAALDSELLWQAGWDTHSEFPATEDELQSTLSETWFDVLDLSLSPALLREDSLPLMAETISAARAASKNPSLTVVASGRAFYARVEACESVGADASTASALQIVLTVTGALQATRTRAAEQSILLDKAK